MKNKHSFKVRWRAFEIWQKLGFNPWQKSKETNKKQRSRDFYKGAFNSIPFLNDDAKRTFVHLLLRPGYMIRDYIQGQHERYLAPLTSLIIFYAFFALVSAILQPIQREPLELDEPSIELDFQNDTLIAKETALNIAKLVQDGYLFLHLDEYPEVVDTKHEAAIAALERTLRNQGIPLFIGKFLLLWLAMILSLRRYRLGSSACAAASAYVLCQFSFFMLFALLLTWGKSTSISVFLMLLLLMLDYHQWLGIPWKKSFWQSVRTGVDYALLYTLFILSISAVIVITAFIK